jgi:putative molybdopterin biosynthesis protein
MRGNHVRRTREVLGLTQKDVAKAVGVSRQSLNAIETGRSVPSVAIALKLARTLSADVESLFASAESEALHALISGPPQRVGSRVSLACVRERWIAHPLAGTGLDQSLQAADGFVRKSPRRGLAQIELARPLEDLQSALFIAGCAPGLGVLCDRLNDARGPGRFRWLMQANNVALRELSRGHTHLAGVHLPRHGKVGARAEPRASTTGSRAEPPVSATGSLSALARYLPTERATLFALANWEAGLVVARGNPKRIRGADALAQPKLRFALREEGSGARRELERLLKAAQLAPQVLEARAVHAFSHMEVANAVHLGAADVGFSIRAVAQALGLDFVPLVEERFDLIVPHDLADDARVLRMLDTITSAWFRRELSELGYDSAVSGAKIGEVRCS